MDVDSAEFRAITEPLRKRWTRKEYEAVCSSGLLDAQRVELIDADVFDKPRKSPAMVYSLARMAHWLREVFGLGSVIQSSSIDVAPEDNSENEPEPDLIVIKGEFTDFPVENPGPQDLLLVVEVADSYLTYDVSTKGALYARAGIADYWVLDIPGRRLIVLRDPQEGRYQSALAYSPEESVAPLAAPSSELRVQDVLPE
jgi:Uma2 family endonuclease